MKTVADDHVSRIRSTLLAVVEECQTSTLRELPKQPGVYFVLDADEIVYVGKAVNLYDRWGKHPLRQKVVSGKYQVAWKLFDADHFDSPEHEEAAFITFLRPRLNKMIHVKLRSSSSDVAIRSPLHCHKCQSKISDLSAGSLILQMGEVGAFLKANEDFEAKHRPDDILTMSEMRTRPSRVKWQIWCDGCFLPIEDRLLCYWIALDQLDTAGKALVWTVDIQTKTWSKATNWEDVVRSLFPSLPWDAY